MANVEKYVDRVQKDIVGIEEADEFLKILAYGRNGSGKTRFAASAPDCLLIDVNERGTKSARRSGAKVYYVRRWEQIRWVYWYLRNGDHPFKSVAIDNWTQLQTLCMKRVLRTEADANPNRDPSMPDRRAWGKVSELMKPLILDFRNLPMHVIFIAQERRLSEEDSEDIEFTPDLSNANRGVLTASVDIIGKMYQAEVRKANKNKKKEEKKWEPRMIVGPHDRYLTKDRLYVLGRVVRQPTVPKILEAANLTKEDTDG